MNHSDATGFDIRWVPRLFHSNQLQTFKEKNGKVRVAQPTDRVFVSGSILYIFKLEMTRIEKQYRSRSHQSPSQKTRNGDNC